MVELPMAGGSANGDQPPRSRKGLEPFELVELRVRHSGGIADREGQLEQVGRLPRILRRRDLKIEIGQPIARIADVDQLRSPLGPVSNVASNRDASVADADHNVGPWRLDEVARVPLDDGEAVTQEGEAPKLIEVQ